MSFVEYAKASPTDILIRDQRRQSRARGSGAARVADPVVPQHLDMVATTSQNPRCADAGTKRVSRSRRRMPSSAASSCIATETRASCSPKTTPTTSAFSARPTRRLMSKDGNQQLCRRRAMRTPSTQTRLGPRRPRITSSMSAPADTAVIRLRLGGAHPGHPSAAGSIRCSQQRRARGGRVLSGDHAPPSLIEDAARVMRQALAGMLWSKQYFFYDTDKWLDEHGVRSRCGRGPRQVRNREWFHMIGDNVISMPDKWEYPWFAAWDLAFHTLALATVDIDFAKQQLDLLLDQIYLHPTGQIPAYEWNFSDVNPPVQAWATILSIRMEQAMRGKTDLDFLKRVFGKLTLEFRLVGQPEGPLRSRACSRADFSASTISASSTAARPLPTGGHLEQADGTAWVALFCQNMLEIAFELAAHDPTYEELAGNYAAGVPADRPSDEQDRSGRHVGRGGRLLLRRASSARRKRYPAQGSLDGRPPAALCHDRRRQVAARAGSQTDRGNCSNALTRACPSCANRSMQPGRAISASRSAASWAW